MSWKQLKNNSYYSINEDGVVKRNAYIRVDKLGRTTQVKEKILKQQLDKHGYYRVTITCGRNKPKFCLVHRLVAETFIENKNNLPVINHKNEIKTDNNVNNLEWCSVSYNNNYGERQKKVSKTQGKKVIGTNGIETIIFNSANEAEKYFKNKKGSNISQCANGKFKQVYGYEWRWA